MASQYGVTLKQLRDLMELRGKEAVDKLQEVGGAQGLCKKLKTSEANGKECGWMDGWMEGSWRWGIRKSMKTLGSQKGRREATGQGSQSANCRDLPHSSTVGRPVGGWVHLEL